MKYIFFILILTGCAKKQEQCFNFVEDKKVVMFSHQKGYVTLDSTTSIIERCELTKQEAEQMNKANNYTQTEFRTDYQLITTKKSTFKVK